MADADDVRDTGRGRQFAETFKQSCTMSGQLLEEHHLVHPGLPFVEIIVKTVTSSIESERDGISGRPGHFLVGIERAVDLICLVLAALTCGCVVGRLVSQHNWGLVMEARLSAAALSITA
jgi:hypothetical protein